MKKPRTLLVLIMVVISISSCDLLNCTPADVKCLQIDIYDKNLKATAIPDTLTVKACGTDSILLNRSLNTQNIQLPLSYHAPVDTFILHNYGKDYSRKDTLFVVKSNNIYFESPDCPTVMMHTIKATHCTKEYIDSVSLVDAKVNFTETTHIRLFIRQ